VATHDYVINNDTGANVRSDINIALSAIASNNSSTTTPSTTYAYQFWADTANDLLKQRNAANNAWISILTLSTGAPVSGGISNVVEDTTPQLGGALDGQDNIVSKVNLKDYGEVTNALGSAGGTRTIDLTLGNSVTATVSASTNTFVFSNPTASDELCGFTLMLTAGSSQTVVWPSTVDWAGATAPALSATVDCLVFWTVDGGTIWNGSTVALNLS
tara:strand:- start:634 stop:1281 length:648 start_codon:yes stop_codon:yes gene_type:complete